MPEVKPKPHQIKTPFTCPECDKGEVILWRGAATLTDGTRMRSLTRFRCRACKAEFFDDDAMAAIEAHRAEPASRD